MLVLRTICTTDWKGRPNHRVVLVATTEDRVEAIKAMDADVAKWMAQDIADEEENNGEQEIGWANQRAADLLATKTHEELKAMWQDSEETRFEMRLHDADHREFVERMDGDTCTIVYHMLNDDMSIPRIG